ncbi:MAG: hypothetical protein VR71_12185 [Roseovarius sp. BRH_c41]|jgi:hypothetical protein|uniref:hypothetical protein n=2 Tax=Roseovarius TaxID=74030 RepID=UPI0005F1A174|nr:hypothetical protein [Roseovarius sp. BRH_c41]KJS43015.1 MAG: hypothetical protein VR71_12185 [Roseovarius sp. BRH_c41]
MLVRGLTLFLIIALVGCNSPGPAFQTLTPQRITIGHSAFDVRIAGTRAQAMRVSPEWAPRLAAVAPRGVAAIEAVSGCRVARLWGDAAVMEAQLDCGAGLPSLPPPQILECEQEPVFRGYVDLICTWRE